MNKNLAVVLLLLLGGCAHPDFLRVGMTREELDSRFGTPAAQRHDPDGDVLIYSSAPLGERASAAHLDAQGRVVSVEPLLNTEHFAQIHVGTWDKNDVLTHFGRPAEISRTRQYEVWSYRYREAETWYSLFHVMYDTAGIVRETQNGPDPMFDPSFKNRF
ncbi:MAG: hypothetical protein ABI277_13610 [Burkholderiaceae bacterium]